jgi:hypothetical protein
MTCTYLHTPLVTGHTLGHRCGKWAAYKLKGKHFCPHHYYAYYGMTVPWK